MDSLEKEIAKRKERQEERGGDPGSQILRERLNAPKTKDDSAQLPKVGTKENNWKKKMAEIKKELGNAFEKSK